MARSVEKRRLLDDASEKNKRWELAEIVDPVHCRVATMPDSKDPANKVIICFYIFPILWILMSLAIILRWSHLSSGCSTSLHKFWCRHSGSWFKWGAEAMEVEKQ